MQLALRQGSMLELADDHKNCCVRQVNLFLMASSKAKQLLNNLFGKPVTLKVNYVMKM